MDKTFNLLDILIAQGEPNDLSDPKIFKQSVAGKFTYNLEKIDDSTFKIHTSLSTGFLFNHNEPTSSHLRHDFVANLKWGGTDMSLRELGIDYDLTPDSINLPNKSVLELATSASRVETTVMASYYSKRLSYETILESHMIKFFILVVSPTMVISNCNLNQEIVDQLCLRCRCGIVLERKIESITGKLLQSQDSGDEQKYKDLVSKFSKLSNIIRHQSPVFNDSIQELSQSQLSDEKKEWVSLLIRKSLRKSANRMKETLSKDHQQSLSRELNSYSTKLQERGTRKSKKRITIFPCATMRDSKWNDNRYMPDLGPNESVPDCLYSLWLASRDSPLWSDNHQYSMQARLAKEEALSNQPKKLKHELRNRSTIEPVLSQSQMDDLALSGPGARLRQALEEVVEKEQISKLSFDLSSPTDDIEEFIKGPALTNDIDIDDINDSILNMLLLTKNKAHENAESAIAFSWLRHKGISQHASLITDICTELAYEYKVPHRKNQWGFKILRNQRAALLFRCTGTHVFFSVAMHKRDTDVWDTGRLGPEIFSTQEYWISDLSSISEGGIEQFVKALPFMINLQSQLLQLMDLPLPQKLIQLPFSYWQMLKTSYLIYLNNKLDLEELITSLRYLYMNILQEDYKDVSLFVERFPTVLRSRLTVCLLNQTIRLMKYYCTRRVNRLPIRDEKGTRRYKLGQVKTIFCESEISMSMLINTFYLGYTVSKFRGKIGERNVKVMEKIITEEFWYLENIEKKGVCLWELREEPLKHCWDHALMTFIIDHHLQQMNEIYGGEFKLMLESDLLVDISKRTFSEIATLKASSHDEELDFFCPNPSEYKDYKELKEEFKKRNPKQAEGRPRVIMKLFETVSKFIIDTKIDNPKVIDVSIWCLEDLYRKGYFVSDLFPKDQHGGDREIHVLHIKARFAQFILERISRVICQYIPSDSILYPDLKDNYYKDHKKRAQLALGEHVTLCKSADASKWCQRHHSSKFFFMLSRYVPPYMIQYCYLILDLWTRKRIMIPMDVLTNFDSNRNVLSTNDFYIKFKNSYYESKPPFISTKIRNTIRCGSGMWQGILHITSTLLHSCLQNFWRSYSLQYLKEQGINSVIDVIQGSDDSAALISMNSKSKAAIRLAEILLEFKEDLSSYISIWKSVAKSSVGTINMIEYNSEWIIDNSVVKPTMRWGLATLETSLVEKFVSRLEIYYSVLAQTLESGGTTFLCSILQLCQGYMHYMLLGCRNNLLADDAMEMMLQTGLIPLGFFPLDSDLNAGLTGFDYLMFDTYSRYGTSTHLYDLEDLSPSATLSYEGKMDKTVRRDINSTKLPFSNYKIWNKLLENADVDQLDDLIIQAESNPEKLFHPELTWRSAKLACSLKLYQPGVKLSLSSHQPNARMMASSAYIMSKPCMITQYQEDSKKRSLFSLLWSSEEFYNDRGKPLISKLVFPHQNEYIEFYEYLENLKRTYFFQPAEMTRSGKTEVLIWGTQLTSDIPLLDICIRAWWKVKTVKVSSTMFSSIWNNTKAKYGFLCDSCEDTCIATGLNPIDLYHFLQSISKRTRKLKLQDSAAKDASKESTMTRVYWPGLKLRSPLLKEAGDVKSLRHKIFCILTYPFILSRKKSLIQDLLVNNIALHSKPESLPKYGRKLKIMRDFLSDGSIENLLLNIEFLKKGTVGFFQERQESTTISGKVVYSGKGKWIGKVCSVPCHIDMINGKAYKITLSRLTDLLELSNTLKTLLGEFNLQMREVALSTPSQLYLSDKGYFENSPNPLVNSCPIFIDKSLRVEVFDELINYNWRLRFSGSRIRLTCQIKNSKHGDPEFTVLSDTFTGRDWDPNIEPISTESDLFTAWQQGFPAKISDIINQFGFDVDTKSIERMITVLQSGEVHVKNNVNIKTLSLFLKKNLLSHMRGTGGILEDMIREDVAESKRREITDSEMFKILENFNDPLEDTLLELIESMEAPSQEQSLDSSQEEEALLSSAIDKIDSLFYNAEWTFEEEMLRRLNLEMEMPKSNSFFQSIFTWFDLEGKTDLLYHCLSGKSMSQEERIREKLPPELRYLLALMSQILVSSKYGSLRSKELDFAAQHEVSLSSFTHDFLITQDEDSLKDSIEQLNKTIPQLKGKMREKFQNLLRRYNQELDAMQSMNEHAILGQIPYWDLLSSIINKLESTRIWVKEIPEANYMTKRTIMISDALERILLKARQHLISELEREEICASAWPEYISQGFLKLLTIGFEFELELFIDNRSVFFHSPKTCHNSIEINLINKHLTKKLDLIEIRRLGVDDDFE